MPRHLVYTLALDPVGAMEHRNMAKLLVSSLLRSGFTGDIVVFHNSPHPLFMVPRACVREVRIEATNAPDCDHSFQYYAQSFKHSLAKHIDPAGYDKIAFIDCDAVVIKPLDPLLTGDWDLAVLPEAWTHIQSGYFGCYLTQHERETLKMEGINSGTWAVRASRWRELMKTWRAIESEPAPFREGNCLFEQSAFNRLVRDWSRSGNVVKWPMHEVALPFCPGGLSFFGQYMNSTIVHVAGAGLPVKMQFLFSVYAAAYLHDRNLTLFNIMEM
jgi:hypothetical protein